MVSPGEAATLVATKPPPLVTFRTAFVRVDLGGAATLTVTVVSFDDVELVSSEALAVAMFFTAVDPTGNVAASLTLKVTTLAGSPGLTVPRFQLMGPVPLQLSLQLSNDAFEGMGSLSVTFVALALPVFE